MTIIEAYKRFQLKLNSLTNSDNVDISPGEFVLIYNEQQNKWYESKFKGRSSKFVLDDVQTLANRDFPLTLSSAQTDYIEFNLPDDYLDFITSYCITSRDTCTNRRTKAFQSMLTNKELLFNDYNSKPSFDYGETFLTVSSDKVQVYKTDFSVDSVFLTYYRYPKEVDIAGYTTVNQVASTNIDPELVDEYVNEILDWCAADVDRTFKDTEAYQLSIDRLNRNTNN